MGRRNLLALILVAAVTLAACGDDGGDANGSANQGRQGAGATVVTVPPLEGVVRGLVDAYNKTSDTTIQLTVTPQAQAMQAVSQGRPAILPGPWLAGVNANSVPTGRNLAIIAVPAGNPSQVTGVSAFAASSGLDTAACGADSVFGNFAALVVRRGGVEPDPARVSSGCETDALGRVARGELDAALLFRSFFAIPEGVDVITIPDDQNIVIDVRYAPAAANASADSFQAFLASDLATQILTQQGLLP